MARSTLVACLALLLLITVSSSSAVETTSYYEDFTTTTYLDAANSTALWDTSEGELRLPDLPLTTVRLVDPMGWVHDAQPFGSYVLITASTSLGVVDMSDPATADIIAGVGLSGHATGLAAGGRYAYAACGTDGVDVIDMGDPLAGARIGNWNRGVDTAEVVLDGHHLYVACGDDYLSILDVSDPTTPVDVGLYNRTANDVAVSGNLAYVAGGTFGLLILDVSDPAAPGLIGHNDPGGVAQGVAVAGDIVLVAAGTAGLQIFDVSDPASPALVGTMATTDAVDVELDWPYAYVADAAGGGLVVDVKYPGAPDALGSVGALDGSRAFIPHGRYGYLCDTVGGLRIIEIAQELPVPSVNSSLSLGGVTDIAVSGNMAAVGTGTGLIMVNITNPAFAYQVGSLGGFGVYDVCLADDHAYLNTSTGDLVVVDVSDPYSPVVVATVSPPGNPQDVAVEGQVAFLPTSGALHSYDVSDPANPVLLDTFTEAGFFGWEIDVQGDRAVVITVGAGFRLAVFDVSDPANLTKVGWTTVDLLDLKHLALSGNRLFTVGALGLQMYTIPGGAAYPDPALVDEDLTYGMYKVVTSGDRLYATSFVGVQIYDIADPTVLTLLGTIAEPTLALARSGDHLLTGPEVMGDVQLTEVTQRRFDIGANVIQSLPIYDGGMNVKRIVKAYQTFGPGLSFEASTDGGLTWHPLDAAANELPGSPSGSTELRWRANLTYQGAGYNPTCLSLTMDWLFDAGAIQSIADIPNDQGRQVRVSWIPSGYDVLYSSKNVDSYQIFRLIDDPAAKAGDLWDFITEVPASRQDAYAAVVPTLADSTISDGQHLSTFYIQTIISDPFSVNSSPAEAGYSLDNLAPSVPMGAQLGENLMITWDDPLDPDFRFTTVYGSSSGLMDGTEIELGHTIGTEFDASGSPHAFYLVTATDFSGNEGNAAVLDSGLSDVGDLPRGRTALHGNHPNPFNPVTVITYELAADLPVSLEIYDLAGRRVRVLETGAVQKAGTREAVWDGTDDRGRTVPAGVYLYRLEAGGVGETKRMVLVK